MSNQKTHEDVMYISTRIRGELTMIRKLELFDGNYNRFKKLQESSKIFLYKLIPGVIQSFIQCKGTKGCTGSTDHRLSLEMQIQI